MKLHVAYIMFNVTLNCAQYYMIVHSVEASPRVGRAFDRPPFELLSSVRRCMALLWCCARDQLDEGVRLG
jgi:hypothetical protein